MVLALCDGYDTHTTPPLPPVVESAGSIRVVLELCVPHSSHVLQVMDMMNFSKFKRDARQAKSDLPVQKAMAGKPPRLTSSDVVIVVKKPWEDVFHSDTSRKG